MVFPSLPEWAALVVRLFLGPLMMAHGYPKVFDPKRRLQTVDFMKTKGVRPFLSLSAGLIEFFGGLGVLVGLLTQVAASFIFIEMVGTTLLSRSRLGKKFMGGYELDLLYAGVALALLFLGPGVFSLDRLLHLA